MDTINVSLSGIPPSDETRFIVIEIPPNSPQEMNLDVGYNELKNKSPYPEYEGEMKEPEIPRGFSLSGRPQNQPLPNQLSGRQKDILSLTPNALTQGKTETLSGFIQRQQNPEDNAPEEPQLAPQQMYTGTRRSSLSGLVQKTQQQARGSPLSIQSIAQNLPNNLVTSIPVNQPAFYFPPAPQQQAPSEESDDEEEPENEETVPAVAQPAMNQLPKFSLSNRSLAQNLAVQQPLNL